MVPVGLLPPVRVAVSLAEPPIAIDTGETEVVTVGEPFEGRLFVKVQVTVAPTAMTMPETVEPLKVELPSLQLAVVKAQLGLEGIDDSETLYVPAVTEMNPVLAVPPTVVSD